SLQDGQVDHDDTTMPRTSTAGEYRRHMSLRDIELGGVCGPGVALVVPMRVDHRHRHLPTAGDWDLKLHMLRELGPRWVRVPLVEHRHRRSPTVTHGREEPQGADPPAQAAGMMDVAIQIVVAKVGGAESLGHPPQPRTSAV